jgi:hypothetical protein
MQTKLIRQALKLWNVPHVPRDINRSNARKWLRAVEFLGDRWLLAKKVTKNDISNNPLA